MLTRTDDNAASADGHVTDTLADSHGDLSLLKQVLNWCNWKGDQASLDERIISIHHNLVHVTPYRYVNNLANILPPM